MVVVAVFGRLREMMGVGSNERSYHGKDMFKLRFNSSSSLMKSTLDFWGADFWMLGNDQGKGFQSSSSSSSFSSSLLSA
ncbi:hypothetical protein ACHAW5_000259 [Stephanodiscus triporus]|uniref:Uncharacterized protein n=1 Tax=Stephanodiscus triporus TaxID=2934178 RepID=A0ABD3NBG1_9STRA